jgi:dihydroorotate dehydrogenase electron transfer subunit
VTARGFAPAAVRPDFVETTGEVRANRVLPGTQLLWVEIELPASFPEPVPGQFVMVAPALAVAAGQLLLRPFSVARAWRTGGALRIGLLYTHVGRGTDLMRRATTGAWTVLGPLGQGFPTDTKGPYLLVGGGRGTAPLVFLAEWLEAHGKRAEFLVGAKTAAEWAGPAEMGAALARTRVWAASEDGSHGTKGRVLDLFAHESALAEALSEKGATIHACGPHGLLEAVGAMSAGLGVPAFVSIEAHMACGTGICRTCVVPRHADGPRPRKGQNAEYLVSCLEGPVVPPACVDWARDRA